MVRPVRMSIIAIFAVLVLFTMQIGVSAKQKRPKRKHRTARSVSVIVMPPVLYPAVADNINAAAPTQEASTPSSAPATGHDLGIESAGGNGTNAKRITARIPTGPHIAAGTLLISEFRVRGPGGTLAAANDEFIEIYNNSGADHVVAAISGTGYAIAASDGVVRCTIPNATVIPAGGHYLCTNSVGYSLAAYPSGNGTTATGDATYVTDIPG